MISFIPLLVTLKILEQFWKQKLLLKQNPEERVKKKVIFKKNQMKISESFELFSDPEDKLQPKLIGD